MADRVCILLSLSIPECPSSLSVQFPLRPDACLSRAPTSTSSEVTPVPQQPYCLTYSLVSCGGQGVVMMLSSGIYFSEKGSCLPLLCILTMRHLAEVSRKCVRENRRREGMRRIEREGSKWDGREDIVSDLRIL